MNSPVEIKKLAIQRLDEASILYKNRMYDGAFYLAGYAVELMLKAKICERFGIPNLFDENSRSREEGMAIIANAVKTHNLNILLILSGLKTKFDADKASNKDLTKGSSLFFGNWNENARYKPCGHMNAKDVEQMINHLKDQKGILKWIENN